MHLEGPWLSTMGKRKGKKKFASAEHARKAREQEESWAQLQAKWGVEKNKAPAKRESLSSSYSLSIPAGRDTTSHIKSVNTGGNAVLKPSPVYTGNKILGISQMAKSNAVPVFNSDHIIEIARMRR